MAKVEGDKKLQLTYNGDCTIGVPEGNEIRVYGHLKRAIWGVEFRNRWVDVTDDV